MKNTSKTSKHCPSAIDLEYLFLEEGLNEESRKRIQLHLQQCSSCRETLEKIESYYKLLIHELSRPVSNKVIDFSKKLSNHPEIRYGLIICEPADLNKSEPGTYKTKVLFQANGVPGKTSLKDFDLLSLPKDQIAIRIMTNPGKNSCSLFLWDHQNNNFNNWVLHFNHLNEKYTPNSMGAVQIPLKLIDDFNDKTLQIEFNKASENKTKIERLKEAILY